MSKEQGVSYNFEAVNTLGAKPKLAYWMAKSNWRQSLLFIFSLLLFLTPLAGLIYAAYFNLLLMQNICLGLSIVGMIQFIIVQDFFETINYISHAESCRQKQVLGIQKIQSLNDTMSSNMESLRQKREEIEKLQEQNITLERELESVGTILKDHTTKDTQSARIVSELTEAINKVITELPENRSDLNEIKHALNGFSNALKEYRGKIIINGQHYAALKGLLLKFGNTPHNFARYSQLSEQTIVNYERKILYLTDILQKIQHAAIAAQKPEKLENVASSTFKQGDVILDIHHLSNKTLHELRMHPEPSETANERKSLAKARVDTSVPILEQATMFQAIGEFVGLSPTKDMHR